MIVFRQINEDLPDNWLGGVHWYVEYHDDAADMAFPLGTAYCSVYERTRCVVVDYILVADEHRRKGIATELIAAVRQKWPSILLTDAISDLGEKLIRTSGGIQGAAHA